MGNSIMHGQATRRTVLAAFAGSTMRASAGRQIRLGGPIFLKSDDPRELARETPPARLRRRLLSGPEAWRHCASA